MENRDNDRNIGNNQYDQNRQGNIFDDKDIVEDIDSVQDPYPANNITGKDEILDDTSDGEIDNDDNIHEYEDTDHPHEYQQPSAVLDDLSGVSGGADTNPYEQQNPLQSTYPSSERDR